MIARFQQVPAATSFDHLVGTYKQGYWHIEVYRLGSSKIDGQLEFCGSLRRKIARFVAPEDTINIICSLTKLLPVIRAIGDKTRLLQQRKDYYKWLVPCNGLLEQRSGHDLSGLTRKALR